jgi:transglutaminase-like putative cysteine protease
MERPQVAAWQSRGENDNTLMRIRVTHESRYHYGQPAKGMIQILRLTPRDHDGQYVVNWRIEVSDDCRLDAHEDAFGNLVHTFSIDGPLEEMRIAVEGEVETQDTNGIIRGTVEPFPPSLFLRETPLTEPSEAIATFARSVASEGTNTLAIMHALMNRLHEHIDYDTEPTHPATTAAEAFALKRGVCQDLTHVFLGCARTLGTPARYVGGYFHRADGVVQQEAGHAWAEAHIDDLGWVAFDPANRICATDAHVRVAVGLDYLGASPIRGTRYGGGDEKLDVAVHVDQAFRQSQT